MLDVQTYIENAVRVSRQESLANSDQLTLGELILKIEPMLQNQDSIKEKYEHEARVVYDFEYLFPLSIDSWRGIYRELALDYNVEGTPMAVSEFFKMLKGTIGTTFEGYKGGDFLMTKQTPIWVANYGNYGNTAVIDVVNAEYDIILITAYRES